MSCHCDQNYNISIIIISLFRIKRRVLKRFYVNSIQAFTTKKSTTPASSAVQKADEATDGQDDETQPILPGR